MMKKWKIGSLYIKGFSDLVGGYIESELEIYKLIDMNEEKRKVTFLNTETNKKLTIDQDDRYGRYPLLDKNKIKQVEETYDNYYKRVEILRESLKLMNKLGLRDDR